MASLSFNDNEVFFPLKKLSPRERHSAEDKESLAIYGIILGFFHN